MSGLDLNILSATKRPWFWARANTHEVATDGTKQCLLGHRVDYKATGVADGMFVEWDWDGTQLQVKNDRYGLYPLFYACYGREIWISPAIQQVLRGSFPKDLNFPALAVLLRLGFFVGDDTPFAHVHLLPPASRLTWRDGEMTLETGPVGSRPPATPVRNFDDAVDQYATLFRQAIERRSSHGEAFTVPISGGRDSRHILFELLSQGHRPSQTVTVKRRPPASNEDLRVARILAQGLAVPHAEIEMPPSFLRANLKDIELTYLSCYEGHSWMLPVAVHLKNSGARYVYDGLAGDVLSAGAYITQEKEQLFRECALKKLARLLLRETKAEGVVHALFRQDFTQRMSEAIAVERLHAELEKHRNERQPVLSWVFWNRIRRSTGLIPFGILADVPTVYCPYQDHDLFDFLMNLDSSYGLSGELHDETIRRAYPQWAHLPFEDKSAPGKNGASFRSYYRRAVVEFAAYLAARPGTLRSKLVRTDRVWMRIARDLTRSRSDMAWYLRPALYVLELERAAGSDTGA